MLPEPERVELEIEGMTCAGCASRIERELNRLDGVDARVNFATEEAFVTFDPVRVGVSALLEQVEHAGYHATVAGETERDRTPSGTARLVVAAALTVPVALLSMFGSARFEGWEWVAFALTTPVVLWSGFPFHATALRGLRHGTVTMDTLVSLGTSVAYGWSVAVLVLGLDGDTYFEVAAVITTLILLGRWLEARAKRRSTAAIRSLAALGATDAVLLRDGVEVRVPVEALRVGDRFVVRPGERVATDGVVLDGRAAVDTSMLSGEPVPVEVTCGDAVTGGTVATDGVLVVEATRVGADTALARIGRLVAQAQAGKAPVERLVDRISRVFVPAVVALAAATFVGWLAVGASGGAAVTAAVAVLIVACPCALGLATPTALVVGTGRGAELGVLIHGPEVLEQTRAVTTVVLDKTGTLTEGRLRVTRIVTDGRVEEGELLRLAGAAEHGSEHPVGRAVVEHAVAQGRTVPAATGFRSHAGAGVAARVEGRDVVVAGRAACTELGIELGEPLASAADEAADTGATVVVAGWDGRARGLVLLADRVKATAPRAVAELRDLGLAPVLATGDNPRVAHAVAEAVGIDDVVADTLPEDKVNVVARLQADGNVVAMIGDGVNDAPALARADLGLALGSGADIATEAADVTLVSGDLLAAVDAIRLSRRTLRTIHVNLFWAFAYNVAALPLAALGLLEPMLASAAMACSSLFVVGNSLRLRRFGSVRAS